MDWGVAKADKVPHIKMVLAASTARAVTFQRQSEDNLGSFISMVKLGLQV